MQNHLNKLVKELGGKAYIDKKALSRFIRRIKEDNGLTREENKQSHFCSFFLPVNLSSKRIFLVHHKKGDDWMPPGGHIDRAETPKETVFREFGEELDYKLTNERVELFDISITDIKSGKVPCRAHYDFWYLVFIGKMDFKWLKDEFYAAGWFEINKGISKIKKNPQYRKVLRKMKESLF